MKNYTEYDPVKGPWEVKRESVTATDDNPNTTPPGAKAFSVRGVNLLQLAAYKVDATITGYTFAWWARLAQVNGGTGVWVPIIKSDETQQTRTSDDGNPVDDWVDLKGAYSEFFPQCTAIAGDPGDAVALEARPF